LWPSSSTLNTATLSSAAAGPTRSLGLIGFGNFGRFIAPWLTPHFQLTVSDIHDVTDAVATLGVRSGTPHAAAACDIVVLSVPVQALEAVLRDIASVVRPGALVVDVASVKLRPVELLRRYLAEHVSVVGLHPLFGPQSGRNGIAGLPIVVCPIRPADPISVRHFLSQQLGLSVTVLTPEAHDRAMAHVQALTHIVAAVLARMELPTETISTAAYASLLRCVELVHGDARELFLAIQHQNPFATAVRQQFALAVAEVLRDIDGEGAQTVL
jgi:prephenate dehydrogenase